MPSPVPVLPQRSRSPSPGSTRSGGHRRTISWDILEPGTEDELKRPSPPSDIFEAHWGVDPERSQQGLSSLRKIVPKLCAPGQSTGPPSVHPIFNQGKARNGKGGSDIGDRLEQLEMRMEWWHQHHEMQLEQVVRSLSVRHAQSRREKLKSQRRSMKSAVLPMPSRNSEWPDSDPTSSQTASGSTAARHSGSTQDEAPKQEDGRSGNGDKEEEQDRRSADGFKESDDEDRAEAPDGEGRPLDGAEKEHHKAARFEEEGEGNAGDEPAQDDQEDQVRRSKSSNLHWLRTDIDRTRSNKNRTSSVKQESMGCLIRIVKHPHFDHLFACAIILNAVFIAVQTEYLVRTVDSTDQPSNTVFFAIDKVFATVFLLELTIRVFGLRSAFFAAQNAAWNCFDSVLVVMSVIEVILEMRGLDANGEVGNTASGKVMRMFRMARVVRVMRVLRFLDDLRTMVLLILHSMRALFWLMVLLAMILFTFAIFFTQGVADFLTQSEPSEADGLLRYFYGGLADSSLTLFMSITGGVSWIEAVEPLKTAGWELMGLFIIYVSFCVFSVLNIVTGVFVDGAIQRSAQERDKRLLKEKEQKEVYINMLMDLLHEIDSEGTGVITRGMLEDAFRGERVRYTFSVLDIDIHDSNYLFDMLDTDGSGEVDMEEFVVGCLRLKGNAKSIDIHTLMFEIRHLMRRWDVLFNED